jgi:2-polyprenyl-6-hydroxyphenyl methylase/3-demethylubiquinone-9 3-methyltransferase
MAKNTICLWYDHDAEKAANFYAATFPNTKVGKITRAPSDYPNGKAGDTLIVDFNVMGIPCVGLLAATRSSTTRRFRSKS